LLRCPQTLLISYSAAPAGGAVRESGSPGEKYVYGHRSEAAPGSGSTESAAPVDLKTNSVCIAKTKSIIFITRTLFSQLFFSRATDLRKNQYRPLREFFHLFEALTIMLIADEKREASGFLQYFGLASRMGYLYWLRALQLPSSHCRRHPNRRRRGRPNAPLPMRATSQERRECRRMLGSPSS
jgi:hypothetical protein